MTELRRPPRRYDYLDHGATIYVESFATIRGEASFEGLPAYAEKLGVRMIHGSGKVDLVRDLVVHPLLVPSARAALAGGAPILTDARMVAMGITAGGCRRTTRCTGSSPTNACLSWLRRGAPRGPQQRCRCGSRTSRGRSWPSAALLNLLGARLTAGLAVVLGTDRRGAATTRPGIPAPTPVPRAIELARRVDRGAVIVVVLLVLRRRWSSSELSPSGG